MGRVGVTIAVLSLLYMAVPVRADEPANVHFERTWARTDRPVAAEVVDRTWMWGPEAFSGAMIEPYLDLALENDERVVQYFDKARMEINDPRADVTNIWYVSNGLLVVELMTGRLQVGESRFELRDPAVINVAGDPEPDSAPGTSNGPTYASMAPLMSRPPGIDSVIIERIDEQANVTSDPGLAQWNVTRAFYVVETNHNVASVFWSFMNVFGPVYVEGEFVDDLLFQNPFFATGYPITEAYWTTVLVDAVARDVLVQCFERRCLTYTPDNPDGWRVESGNVGRHYYQWRYGQAPDELSAPAPPIGSRS